MVNRNIQAKLLKKKRGFGKGRRYARFSGETAKYAVRVDRAAEHQGEDKVRIKEVQILVGSVSLSKQAINTGRGPDPERMQQYYSAVKPKSFQKPVPERTSKEMAGWLSKFAKIIAENRHNYVTLAETATAKLILACHSSRKEWFFIEIDYAKETFRRSRDYNTKETAMDRLRNKRVSWIEEISS